MKQHSGSDRHIVFVEAEQFQHLGGWVVDSQFMDQMGSAFLLAHGLGSPVADATTSVRMPVPGQYRLWVRTRDWVAPWNALGAPGKFQLLINGKPCPVTFGTEGADWHWQDGGMVQLHGSQVELVLRDLTGFEGRCDAILFCSDKNFVPPQGGPALAQFRRQCLGLPEDPESVGMFDLVVVGGGIAGICSAVSASRLGLKVALVQNRPMLGGNNSSEVRVWLGGEVHQEPYPRIGDVVSEMEQHHKFHYGPKNTAEIYEDARKLAVVWAESNITSFLSYHVEQVAFGDGKIQAVVAREIRSGRRIRIEGRWFVDCTGDGEVGFLAGADHEIAAANHMGPGNLWNVVDTGKPISFPRCPWALDLSDKPFPGRGDNVGQFAKSSLSSLGGWFWESGFSHDPITQAEYTRDLNFRAMYGAWDALKNIDRVYPNHRLNWAAYISGKRESRRLLGDVILSKTDLLRGRIFEDACFPCTWGIDLHLPDVRYCRGFEGDEFIARVAPHETFRRPFWAPYRCLYSRNVANLFMAGRDISVTREALGTVRVMRTGGAMGEIVGMAASLCKKHQCNPRDIYLHHLRQLKSLMSRGVGRRLPLPMSKLISPPPLIETKVFVNNHHAHAKSIGA